MTAAPRRAFDATPPGPMLVMLGVLQLAKRLGLAKAMTGLAIRRMVHGASARQAFAGYRPGGHDVFVATYGKSGTNWMMQIAQQVAFRGKAEFGHIHEVVPWPDAPMRGLVDLSDDSVWKASPTGLRAIKTHLEAGLVPYAEEAKYLTLLRDPKEVLVSAYFFLGGILGVLSHLGIDAWYDLAMRPGRIVTAWARHSASFWAWRDRPNVFLETYGDALRDPRATVEGVAEVMGVALTEDELARVLERSSFSYMKAHESQFAPPRNPFARAGEEARMIRSGKSGHSAEVLSRAQQAEIDRVCQAELRRLGSDLPYAELFQRVEDRGESTTRAS